MKTRIIFSVLAIVMSALQPYAQSQKRQVRAVRIEQAPQIDGKLDESLWSGVPEAGDFVQINPYNGAPAWQKSAVKFVYDNDALYVGAMLYDTAPDSILTYLSKRDEHHISDYFGIFIDTYNDALVSYGFLVTAAGVQIDMEMTDYEQDANWEAVWESAVYVGTEGWSVEMRIPYSALRFSQKEEQVWGLNTRRNIQRHRQNTSWSYIDNKIQNISKQSGELIGISNIKPPLRLSLTPYISAYIEKDAANKSYSYSVKGGMDLKYGISESFTLDMMLIPDFGQVQSDDEVLNLTPFETYYDERRSFFMEGVELFGKADIFYSRRIGGKPIYYDDVSEKLNTNEKIVQNPIDGQLINATKISGKTQNGLSIGFQNAMALRRNAVVKDTITGTDRQILTNPFCNYNLIVVDKSLPNNSYIGLINTNVFRPEVDYMANVSGTEFKFANKSGSYALNGIGTISQIFDAESDDRFGHSYNISIEKTKGNFRFELLHRVESDTYDPNDMGFLMANNEFTNNLELAYNIYEPFNKVLHLYNTLTIYHSMLYEPRKFFSTSLSYRIQTTFTNQLFAMYQISYYPVRTHDYFEPRVANRKYIDPQNLDMYVFMSSDYRKTFAFDFEGSIWQGTGTDEAGYYCEIEPRVRIADRMYIEYGLGYDYSLKAGYVDNSVDSIYFGKRDRTTLTNAVEASYIFSDKASLNLRVRHYWSRVFYTGFYLLNNDGELDRCDNYYKNQDMNYNAFTVDLVYTWDFAPGSKISVVWKNAINTNETDISNRYFTNLTNTFSAPQLNSFSIRLFYYLDYNYLKNRMLHKTR